MNTESIWNILEAGHIKILKFYSVLNYLFIDNDLFFLSVAHFLRSSVRKELIRSVGSSWFKSCKVLCTERTFHMKSVP